MDVSKVSNTSVDELYGDIDEMYVSQSSGVPTTVSDSSVLSSMTSEEPSSTTRNQSSSSAHVSTGKDRSKVMDDDAMNVTPVQNTESTCDDTDDDFNLYDETIGEEHQNKTDSYNALKKQCKVLMARLTYLETENKSLHMKFDKTELENLEAKRNIARLLLTTKGELSRKDKEIVNLRKRLSVSPGGNRMKRFGLRAAAGSSSFSSVDSDFDPLCVSSPGRVLNTGKSTLPHNIGSRLLSCQENKLSPSSKITNTACNRTESPHNGSIDTGEFTDRNRNKKDEDRRKQSNSASENRWSTDTDGKHKLDRKKETIISSDGEVKGSERKVTSDKSNRTDRGRNRSGENKRKNSEKDRNDSTDIVDKQERTYRNVRTNIRETNNMHRDGRKSCNERVTGVCSTSDKCIESDLERSDKIQISEHSLKSRVQRVSNHETKEKQSSSMKKERDRNQSGDERRRGEKNESSGKSKSGTKTTVLDLREKLRQKRLKSARIDICESPEIVYGNSRNQAKIMESQHVKDPIVEAEKVSESKHFHVNDELENNTNKDPTIRGVVEYNIAEDTKIKYRKEAGKTDFNCKPKNCSKEKVSEDLEFLNKLKSFIRKESVPNSKNISSTSTVFKSGYHSGTENEVGDATCNNSKLTSQTQTVKELDSAECHRINGHSDNDVEVAIYESDLHCSENDNIEGNPIKKTKQDKIITANNTSGKKKIRKECFETHVGTETKEQALTEVHETSKSDCDKSSSAVQIVCNVEYVGRKSEVPSRNLLTEKTSEKSTNLNVSFSKAKSCQESNSVSSKTDFEECSGSNSEASWDSDHSENCAGVSSETVSSCTSTKMSKSVMEYFQTIDNNMDSINANNATSDTCLKSNNSSIVDKPWTCEVKNCTIKMRHLHPKQSTKNTVCKDVELVELPCTDVRDSNNCKTGSPELSSDKSRVLNDKITNIEIPLAPTESTCQRNSKANCSGSPAELRDNGMFEVNDMNPSKNTNEIQKNSCDNVDTYLPALSALSGSHREDTETYIEATNGTSDNKAMQECRLEMNEPDIAESMIKQQASSLDITDDVCASNPDVKMGDPDEYIAENESDGSFGSNIVSEKTESWESSDNSDSDDGSCSTCSDDTSSEGDASDSGPIIDGPDYASSESQTSDSDENYYLSDLEENDGEKVLIKTTSALSVKPTSENNSDNTTKVCISGYANKDNESKGSCPEANNSIPASDTVNKELDSVNEKSVDNCKFAHSENENKSGDVLSRKSHSAIEIETVERNTVTESEKCKSEAVNYENTRSNMLLQLLNCVEKEYKDRNPKAVNNGKECAHVDGSIKECTHIDSSDHDGVRDDIDINSEVREVVTELLNKVSDDTLHVLFGSPLSMSNHSCSGSGSDSDSSYSSHSSDCSTCSSYSSYSGSSSDSDSEDGEDVEDNTESVNHQTQKNVNNKSIVQGIKRQNCEDFLDVVTHENIEKTSKAFSHTSVENKEKLVNESDSMENSDHDMLPSISAKVYKKSDKLRSSVQKDAATVCSSESKLNHQTPKKHLFQNTPYTKSINMTEEANVTRSRSSDKSRPLARNCGSSHKSGESLSSSTCVSPQTPNPYLIVDEIPEFLKDGLPELLQSPENSGKSSSCSLPRDSTCLARPAAIFISPKKVHIANSQTAHNSSLGVISSVENDKFSVVKSKSMPVVTIASGDNGSANSSSFSVKKDLCDKTFDHDERECLMTTKSRSRNNSHQSKKLDLTEKVTKEPSSLAVETNDRKSLETSSSSANQKKEMKYITKSPTNAENSKIQVAVEESSVTKSVLRRSPRKLSSVSQTRLPVTRNDKKQAPSDKSCNKERRYESAGSLFGKALSEKKLQVVKGKSDNKGTKDRYISRSRKTSESTSRSRKTSESTSISQKTSESTSISQKTSESTSRPRKTSESTSISQKISDSRPECDTKSANCKNVNKANLAESVCKQLDSETMGKKVRRKSGGKSNHKKSDSSTISKQSDIEKIDKRSDGTMSAEKVVRKSAARSMHIKSDGNAISKHSGVDKLDKQSDGVNTNKQSDRETVHKLSDNERLCKQSSVEIILRQCDKKISTGHTGFKKNSSSLRTVNTSGHKDIKNEGESSNRELLCEYKPKNIVKEGVGNKKDTCNVAEKRRHPSSTLPSPLKKFTIPKLKRKASTSPPEDKKVQEKRRKPLQTMSPVKSSSLICLKRTSDGRWSKTQPKTNTLRVSENIYSSSSDDSSECSSIINALFGSSSDEKEGISNNTKRRSEKDHSSASMEQLAKKKEEMENKNKDSTAKSLSKDNNTKTVQNGPLLFIEEHTMDRTDYEDMLCLDNCEDDFDDDISKDFDDDISKTSLEDGEVSSASEPENKCQQVSFVSEDKNIKTRNDSDSKDVFLNSSNKHEKNRTIDSNLKTLSKDNKSTEVNRRRNQDRISPNYRHRGRYRSRSPSDSRRRTRPSYDRDRKYPRNDPYFSPRDRKAKPTNKRRRSGSRNRDSDSFRSKRRNTSGRS